LKHYLIINYYLIKTKTMKKLFFSIFMLVLAAGIFAQEVEQPTTGALVSKKGEAYLPESGDWAISFDASPVFEYVGNAFNGNTFNQAPGATWLNQNRTIVGKLFLDDKTAIRAIVRLGFGNSSRSNMVDDVTVTTAPVYPALFPTVEDKLVTKGTSIAIGGGYEMRRGKTRLQGYYGGDIMIWVSSSSDKYTYGNKLTNLLSANGISSNFGSNLDLDQYGNSARVTSYKSGMTIGVGIRGFIGAEYFIFPKIAIGAEYGWGVGFQKVGKSKREIESTNGTIVSTISEEGTGTSAFGFDTDINQNNPLDLNGSNTGTATLRVTFHF
jgi:hypothetical protein